MQVDVDVKCLQINYGEYHIAGTGVYFVPENVRSKQDQRFLCVLFSFLCRHYKLNHVATTCSHAYVKFSF